MGAQKYNTVVESVYAIQFIFDNLKDIYLFLGYGDCTYTIKGRILSGIVSDATGNKFAVAKENWIVKDKNDAISIYTDVDFKKKFAIVES